MRFTRPLALVAPILAALTLGACGGDSTSPAPAVPHAPSSIINDGSRTGGNPDFFFLPPVVANPSSDPDFSRGLFAGGWKPIVEVCEVNASNLAAGCIGSPVKTYSGAAVSVSSADELYQVQIDTKDTWAVGGHTYRFTVILVGNQSVKLGFVDIALLSGAAKNAGTGDLVVMQDGRTIPLKFRIEKGATVDAGIEVFSETLVTDAGATVLTGGSGGRGTFAIRFPADWLPAGFEQAVITVERANTTDANPCTVSVPNLIQTSDCWRVSSYPEIPRITQDLTVAFCPAITPTDPRYAAQEMFKFDAPDQLVELDGVATTLVNCNLPGSVGQLPDGLLGKLRHGAMRVARGLAAAFGPNTAYAIDLGWGGRIAATEEDIDGGVFSEFFWGIPLHLSVFGGNAQSGAAGTTLTSPVSVRVVGEHHHGEGGIPIPGVAVTFSPTESSGSVATPVVMTNADGVATALWTLGTGTGPQSLVASISSVGEEVDAGFTATAVPSVDGIRVEVNGEAVGSINVAEADQRTYIAYPLAGTAPASVTCDWTSDNPDVLGALMFAGTQGHNARLFGEMPGTANITVTCGGFTRVLPGFVSSTVIRRIDVMDAQTGADVGALTGLTVGATRTFRVTPQGLTNEVSGPCSLFSSNPSVATVLVTDVAGASIYVNLTGVAVGSANFVVSCRDGAFDRSVALDVTAPPAPTALLSCTNAAAYGGDFIDRGFYIPSYPGGTLAGVDMRFSSAAAGSYTIRLTARQGGYGTAGTLLATADVTVGLADDVNTFTDASFRWPAVNVTQGSVVAFELSRVSGPGTSLPYYAEPSAGDANCPIVQTNGTTPPLDTQRRQGIWGVIYSQP